MSSENSGNADDKNDGEHTEQTDGQPRPQDPSNAYEDSYQLRCVDETPAVETTGDVSRFGCNFHPRENHSFTALLHLPQSNPPFINEQRPQQHDTLQEDSNNGESTNDAVSPRLPALPQALSQVPLPQHGNATSSSLPVLIPSNLAPISFIQPANSAGSLMVHPAPFGVAAISSPIGVIVGYPPVSLAGTGPDTTSEGNHLALSLPLPQHLQPCDHLQLQQMQRLRQENIILQQQQQEQQRQILLLQQANQEGMIHNTQQASHQESKRPISLSFAPSSTVLSATGQPTLLGDNLATNQPVQTSEQSPLAVPAALISNGSNESTARKGEIHGKPGQSASTSEEIAGGGDSHNTVDTTSVAKPVRPLNAYNFFYREERMRLIEERRGSSSRRISLAEMTGTIATRWNDLPPNERQRFENLAQRDNKRYQVEKNLWERRQMDELGEIQKRREATVDEATWKNYFDSAGKSPAKRRKS